MSEEQLSACDKFLQTPLYQHATIFLGFPDSALLMWSHGSPSHKLQSKENKERTCTRSMSP